MAIFKRKEKYKPQDLLKHLSVAMQRRQVLSPLLGASYQTQPNFDEMYRQYAPEQLEELIFSLEETLQFLEYQKALATAFDEGQSEGVKYLQKNNIKSNLAYLKKDEGWRLRILTKDHHNRRRQSLANVTLFQRISLDRESSRVFENLIYSIHLLSDRQDKHSQTYINRVTNYISQIILIQKEELGGLTPFKNAEKLIYQKEYDKYIKPFEVAVAQLSEKENL